MFLFVCSFLEGVAGWFIGVSLEIAVVRGPTQSSCFMGTLIVYIYSSKPSECFKTWAIPCCS